jgi:hypothetical protein
MIITFLAFVSILPACLIVATRAVFLSEIAAKKAIQIPEFRARPNPSLAQAHRGEKKHSPEEARFLCS